MSLAIAFKGSEGLVLAADSRVTLSVQLGIPGTNPPQQVFVPAGYDNATKLLKIANQKRVAAVTYGTGTVGDPEPRTAHSLLPEFESTLDNPDRLSVEQFAIRLSDFFVKRWKDTMPAAYTGQPMTFVVGGYDEGEAYGRIYEIQIPNNPQPVEKLAKTFGIMWGGMNEITARIINGFDPSALELIRKKLGLNQDQVSELAKEIGAQCAAKIPYQFLPLQDCIDLSILLIRTTSQLLDYQTTVRGVGGAIDVATITRQEGFQYVQQKKIHGERERI